MPAPHATVDRSHLPRLYVVRHGETEWALTGKHTGRSDVPLTERGERQAQALRPRLEGLRVARVLSSPLVRALRTAQLALPGANIERNDDLMEWDYGSYEGKRTVDIVRDRPGWNLFIDGCPGGETLDQLSARVDRTVAQLRALQDDVIVFAHREVIRVLAVRWVGLPALAGRHFLLDTAAISVLGYDHNLDEPAIIRFNT